MSSQITNKTTLKSWGKLLENGWVRVGTEFIRDRYVRHGEESEPHDLALDPANAALFDEETWQMLLEIQQAPMCQVMPLRYIIEGLQFSKSQRKVLRKNEDLKCIIRPYQQNETTDKLFEKWYKARFGRVLPLSIWIENGNKPFRSHEIAVYDKDKLVACSFFDPTPVGNFSAIACYDPDEEKRSLGTYTLLLEIEHTAAQKKYAHYPGTAFHQPSVFDYKKKFNTVEWFDWESETWQKL